MIRLTPRLAGAALLLASLAAAQTDKVAVYLKVDKVVLEPNAEKPERAQIWGVFSLANPAKRQGYLPAARGYLYYRRIGDPVAISNQWRMLAELAGKGFILSFGNRNIMKPRLRPANETPHDPDPYEGNADVARVWGREDYPPVEALLDFKK